jgi:CheY-like chemotaxis protein
MTRILVIDDNYQMLDVIDQMLTNAGYDVIKAMNGTQGVRLYRNQPFDLVVTDLFMPEKDGLEITMELRKDFPDVKIIMHSGHAFGSLSLESSKKFGATRTLPSPFTEEELLRNVREVLEPK